MKQIRNFNSIQARIICNIWIQGEYTRYNNLHIIYMWHNMMIVYRNKRQGVFICDIFTKSCHHIFNFVLAFHNPFLCWYYMVCRKMNRNIKITLSLRICSNSRSIVCNTLILAVSTPPCNHNFKSTLYNSHCNVHYLYVYPNTDAAVHLCVWVCEVKQSSRIIGRSIKWYCVTICTWSFFWKNNNVIRQKKKKERGIIFIYIII